MTVNRVKKLTDKTREHTEKINQIDNKMDIIMEHLGIKIDDNDKKKNNQ